MALVLAACSSQASVPAAPPAGYQFPALTGRVVDQAELLTAADTNALDARSAALEKATGHQLVVVTVPTLGGHPIEDYGLKLGNYWRIGRKGHNDGVLLVVAPNERKARIEVGLGLEKTLTNAEASQILQRDVLPAFRRGDMPGGIRAGVDDIIDEISVPLSKAA